MGCRNLLNSKLNPYSIGRIVPLHAISEAVAITTDFKWTMYTVFLPLLEGQFRAVLQGNEENEMDICLESADNVVETRNGVFLVYIHAGTDPFEVIYQTSG